MQVSVSPKVEKRESFNKTYLRPSVTNYMGFPRGQLMIKSRKLDSQVEHDWMEMGDEMKGQLRPSYLANTSIEFI